MLSFNNISLLATRLTQTAVSLLRVLLLSRPVNKIKSDKNIREMVVLGNGPSLRSLLDRDYAFLQGKDLTAVNFFANTAEFADFKAKHYILADPHFFRGTETDPNVARLWGNLLKADWSMILHVPVNMRRHPLVVKYMSASASHQISCFNLTPAEGFGNIRRMLYDLGLAMPRPRNVMIPAIMEAIRSGYKKIYLAGADHSWSRTLSVDNENRVVSIQPHFYKDNENEKKRVSTEYAGYHLHDILQSLYIAFSSYHVISDYASYKDVDIINITPDSFIDAFPRLNISSEIR